MLLPGSSRQDIRLQSRWGYVSVFLRALFKVICFDYVVLVLILTIQNLRYLRKFCNPQPPLNAEASAPYLSEMDLIV